MTENELLQLNLLPFKGFLPLSKHLVEFFLATVDFGLLFGFKALDIYLHGL